MLDFENNNYDLFGKYQRYEIICKYLHFLAQKYPKICQVDCIGHSWEKREILSMRISENSKATRPVAFVEGGCHAREWISVAVALNCIHQLVENFADNLRYLKKMNWIIVPCVNPDGYEFSFEKNKNWRKTRCPNEGSEHRGVDCNRNFDVSWTLASKRPSLSNFRGPVPFSEPETRALRDSMIKDKPKFYIAIHSHSKALLYPYAFKKKLPETWKQLHAVAKVGHDAIIAATGKRYVYGSTSSIVRRNIGGSSADYAYQVAKIPFVITLEMSGRSFHPPPKKIIELVQEGWVGIREMVLFVSKK